MEMTNTTIESLIKEFGEKFNWLHAPFQNKSIASFLRLRLTTLLTDLRSEVEGLRITENVVCYCKTHPEHNCAFTSNEAIRDAAALITKVIEEKNLSN